jgi:hypothetical protein
MNKTEIELVRIRRLLTVLCVLGILWFIIWLSTTFLHT